MNVTNPEKAFGLAAIPSHGVGLKQQEVIVATKSKRIHRYRL